MPQRMIALSLVALLLMAPAVSAKDAAELAAGSRVRLRLEGSEYRWVGRVVALDTEGLTLLPDGASNPLRFDRARMERLEVSRGRRRHTLLGLSAGLMLAVMIVTFRGNRFDSHPLEGPWPTVEDWAWPAMALVGATLTGAVTTTERWQRVDQPGLRVGMRISF